MGQSGESKLLNLSAIMEPLAPMIALLLVVIPIALKNPRAVNSYRSLNILLIMATPIIFATMAQMMAMSIGEIDFSLGNLISLVTCIVGTVIPQNFPLGMLLLAGIIAIYVVIGAFLHLKKLPSIIVTIGMSFVWLGIAVIIQPRPGGTVPAGLAALMQYKPPFIPFPIVIAVVTGLAGYALMSKTYFGILCRGVGGNVKSIEQAGHSVLKVRILVFASVGFLAILSGAALSGITTSADSLVAKNYTLLAVSGVILGGGSFSGGKVSAPGAVMGALTMHLVNYLLMSYKLPTDWQAGAQGATILLVLFLVSMFQRSQKIYYV
ncbi:sugar ABC transporter permease [Synergistales bacterium]|nr:sugar ABC transporter permease [Synergistales bacterium]